MQHRSHIGAIIILGVAVTAVCAIALIAAQPAQAQCGSQASSCKNCHETQSKLPVNNDGTGWHGSHAFGDFCYICHGGNNQATDETAAHAGMVAPMSDVQAACAQCHPNDLQARADVYAAKLGVTASTGIQPPAPISASPASTQQLAAADPGVAPVQSAAVSSADLVDYVARYNQEVLHRQPTNWGNVILIGLVILLALGGAFFVNRREGWVSISLTEKKPLAKEYPADIASLADQAAKLNPVSRESLARLLAKPAALTELLSALDRLTADAASAEEHITDSDTHEKEIL